MTFLDRGEPDSEATEAQRVHTVAYLAQGFINPDQLNEQGLYEDEYTPRAEPILVALGAKEATIRMIHADKKQGGLLSLPTAKHFKIDPTALKEVAHATRLSDITAKRAVEISGLASIRLEEDVSELDMFAATRRAYAMGLRRSLDQGHDLWMMNVEPKLQRSLTMILGREAITQVGEEQAYMGPPTVPVALNPQDVVASILVDKGRFGDMNRADISQTLGGVSEKHLSSSLVKALHANGIETTKNSLLSRAWNNRKAIFYSTIVGYSALRFLPVGLVSEFHGSVPLYAAIDIGTSLTQVASMEVFFRGKNRTRRALGALGTAASFVAPYAYFYSQGNDYPPYVNAVAGGFVAISAGIETTKTLTDNKLRKGLEKTDIPTV